MIKRFNNTFLSDKLNYNQPRVYEWANNVYEKLRQNGLLSDYLLRDKLPREHFDIVDGSVLPPMFIKDDRFTFGYAYKGELLYVENSVLVNMGRLWTLEFELAIDSDTNIEVVSLFSGAVIINPNLTMSVENKPVLVTGLELNKVNKIKIERDHDKVTVTINGTTNFITLDTDEDTIYDVVYEVN